MPIYLHQFKYKDDQIRRLLQNEEPLDREQFLRAAAQAFGGELQDFYFCFGEFDGVALTRFPDEKSAFACAMSIFGQGRAQTVRTIPLLSARDGVEALRSAQFLQQQAGGPPRRP